MRNNQYNSQNQVQTPINIQQVSRRNPIRIFSPHQTIETIDLIRRNRNDQEIRPTPNVLPVSQNARRELFPSTPNSNRLDNDDDNYENIFSPNISKYSPWTKIIAKKYHFNKGKILKKRNRRYTKFKSLPSIYVPPRYTTRNGEPSDDKVQYLMCFMVPGIFNHWDQPRAEIVYKKFFNIMMKRNGKIIVNKHNKNNMDIDTGNYLRAFNTGGIRKGRMKKISGVMKRNEKNKELPGLQKLLVGGMSHNYDINKLFNISVFNISNIKSKSIVVVSDVEKLYKCLSEGVFRNEDCICLKIMLDESKGDLILNACCVNEKLGYQCLKFSFQVMTSTLTQSEFQFTFSTYKDQINSTDKLTIHYITKLIVPLNLFFSMDMIQITETEGKLIKRVIVFDLHGLRLFHSKTVNYEENIIKVKGYLLGFLLLKNYEPLLPYLKLSLTSSQIQHIKINMTNKNITNEPWFSEIPANVETILIAFGFPFELFDIVILQLKSDIANDTLLDHCVYSNKDLLIFQVLFRKLCCWKKWRRTEMEFVIDLKEDEIVKLDVLHATPRLGHFGVKWTLPHKEEIYNSFLNLLSNLPLSKLKRDFDVVDVKVRNIIWNLDKEKLKNDQLSIKQGRYDQWRFLIRIWKYLMQEVKKKCNEMGSESENPILSAYSPVLNPNHVENKLNINQWQLKFLYWETIEKIDKILHLTFDQLVEFFDTQNDELEILLDRLYFSAYHMIPNIVNFAHYFLLLNNLKGIFEEFLRPKKLSFSNCSSQNTEGDHKKTKKLKDDHSTRNKLQNDNQTTLVKSLYDITNEEKDISVNIDRSIEESIKSYNNITKKVINYYEKSFSRDLYQSVIHDVPFTNQNVKIKFRSKIQDCIIEFLNVNNISFQSYDEFQNGIINIDISNLQENVKTIILDELLIIVGEKEKEKIKELIDKWLIKLDTSLKKGLEYKEKSRKRKCKQSNHYQRTRRQRNN